MNVFLPQKGQRCLQVTLLCDLLAWKNVVVYMQGSLLLLVELHKSRKKNSFGCTEIQSNPNMYVCVCVCVYISIYIYNIFFLLEVKLKSKAQKDPGHKRGRGMKVAEK